MREEDHEEGGGLIEVQGVHARRKQKQGIWIPLERGFKWWWGKRTVPEKCEGVRLREKKPEREGPKKSNPHVLACGKSEDGKGG